ncbi:hypothetical protein, partial [Halorubrum sp. SP9]|uniref:hypothetical protein n=1 Tax=Halorubrum sp. SP9 TaxID=1537267 RepID=UPI001A7E0947
DDPTVAIAFAQHLDRCGVIDFAVDELVGIEERTLFRFDHHRVNQRVSLRVFARGLRRAPQDRSTTVNTLTSTLSELLATTGTRCSVSMPGLDVVKS